MRILKIAGWLVGSIIALLIVGIALVALFFDPNDYKTEIETLVKDKTGRTFTLT
ncbi:MAG: AsmA family protein, partial [Steroidobacteraceae bacterium]